MLVTIDIGNTSMGLGVFAGGGLEVRSTPTGGIGAPSELAPLIKKLFVEACQKCEPPTAAVIASVVDGLTGPVSEAVEALWNIEPVIAGADIIEAIMPLYLRDPSTVGPDRLASALAAIKLAGTPVAVVDFGTATTVNYVDKSGAFRGGAILPGVGMMLSCLHERTAGLPEVDPRRPDTALGSDTEDAILSGVVFGSAGAVERIISEIEVVEGTINMTLITGGHAGGMLPLIKRACRHEPHLVHMGLKEIYERRAIWTN